MNKKDKLLSPCCNVELYRKENPFIPYCLGCQGRVDPDLIISIKFDKIKFISETENERTKERSHLNDKKTISQEGQIINFFDEYKNEYIEEIYETVLTYGLGLVLKRFLDYCKATGYKL